MTQPLDYEPPTRRRPSRLLAFCAHVTAGYPLLLLGSLYGQWLLSWRMLGHIPQPSVDDPKSVVGASWMHEVTALVLIGFMPAGLGAVLLNVWYALDRRPRGPRLLARAALVVALWVGAYMLLQRDPGLVLYWWLD